MIFLENYQKKVNEIEWIGSFLRQKIIIILKDHGKAIE